MKKIILIGSASIVAIAAAVFISPLGKTILPESIVEKVIENHTPEQRWSYVEKKIQNDLVDLLSMVTKGNPLAEIQGEDVPLINTTETNGVITIHALPEIITGGEPTGFKNGTITVKAFSEMDSSLWIHPRSKSNLALDLDIALDDNLAAEIGSTNATANAEMKTIVDGENLYISLDKVESNSPLLPLDTPEIQSIIQSVQNKWILFNDAMTNPFLSEGVDLNASNKAFMKALQASLEENIETFTMWEQPLQGVKAGEWYEYNLTLDKAAFETSVKKAYTQAIYALSESLYDEKNVDQAKQKEELENVYLSALDQFNLNVLKSLTAKVSLHETDTDRFKAAITITSAADNAMVLMIDQSEDKLEITSPFVSFVRDDENYTLTMDDIAPLVVSGMMSEDKFTLEYKQGEQTIIMGSFVKEDEKWSGSMTAEPFATLTLDEASLIEGEGNFSSILKASVSMGETKIISVDVNTKTIPQGSVSITTPTDFTPFVDVMTDLFGFNPYAPQNEPATMSDEEIQALLESLETQSVQPIQ